MSVEGYNLSKPGFPFTPSRFKGIPQTGAASAISPVEPWRLSGASVTDGKIDDRPAQSLGENPPLSATLNLHHRPPSRGRFSGLKLMPLGGFVWGSRTAVPLPRTRGEHVLIWVARGTLQLDFPRHRYPLGPGSLYFIPSGTAFAAMPIGDCAGEVLLIAPHLTRNLSHGFPDHAAGGRLDHDAPAPRLMLQDLASEARRATPDARMAIECHLSLLALRLARLEPAARRALHSPADNPDLPLAERFMALAQTRFADGSTIADLAEELGATSAALDAACSRKYGKRAIDRLHDLRLHRAVQMLRDTSESPARIARMLGYTSLAHLSRAFVTATGRLPESFRAGGQATSRCDV